MALELITEPCSLVARSSQPWSERGTWKSLQVEKISPLTVHDDASWGRHLKLGYLTTSTRSPHSISRAHNRKDNSESIQSSFEWLLYLFPSPSVAQWLGIVAESQPVARWKGSSSLLCSASCLTNWNVGLKNDFVAWDDKNFPQRTRRRESLEQFAALSREISKKSLQKTSARCSSNEIIGN